jgi:site-specific recombinase XerD
MKALDLPHLVESFFRGHLQRVRGASPHTILSYRDSVSLLLRFLADRNTGPVSALTLNDITAKQVLALLEHLETERGNSASTRNLRLAAIRCLVEHLLRHDPTRAGQYRRILDIPTKKTNRPSVYYLEPEEVQALLQRPDRRTRVGRAHYALILILYNTGARVSEMLDVRLRDLHLLRPAQVRLRGKGRKERICPLWRQTADAVASLVDGEKEGLDRRVFLNARGQPLSRDGVAYILDKYTKLAADEMPRLAHLRVTPHALRHSCAVALLQAGLDVTVIRDYLGHASVATTSRYISTNLKMKREVLEAFWERAGLATAADSGWEPTPDVLAFLESL